MTFGTALQTILVAVGGGALSLLGKYFSDQLLQKGTQRHGKEQAELQNAFSMGATSHMATVVFDKYVEFCDEYVKAMAKAVYSLVQEKGERPLDAESLVVIRQKWAVWLTDDIEGKLDEFEQRVTRIPSEAPVRNASGAPASIETTVRSVIGDLRKVLGTEELTALRSELVARSLKTLPQVSSHPRLGRSHDDSPPVESVAKRMSDGGAAIGNSTPF